MAEKRTVVRRLLAHLPRRRHAHPGGANLAYCYCGEAIALVAGLWWHLYRVPAHAAQDKKALRAAMRKATLLALEGGERKA